MLNYDLFMHESDRAALNALKAIPGFTPLLKAFMKVWNEKQFRIQNMSTNLRISEKQLPKYYNMLLPICEKLGIDVPEMYLQLDVNPNAYTAGDTKPFIVLTSGLLEHMPEELIPTVIAHECGHIACHHNLYSTMGRIILNGAASFLGLGELAIFPIQVAFSYWMRCSEFSADRAAALCDGRSDNIVEMCMRFSGLDKDIAGEANVEEFLHQAEDYRQMIHDSTWNKTLEFLMLSSIDHPLNAVRAYECREWCKSGQYAQAAYAMQRHLAGADAGASAAPMVTMPQPGSFFLGREINSTVSFLQTLGFTRVYPVKHAQPGLNLAEGQVMKIALQGRETFDAGEQFAADTEIYVEYYSSDPTPVDHGAAQQGYAPQNPAQGYAPQNGMPMARMPGNSVAYLGKYWQEVVAELQAAGLTNVAADPRRKEKKGFLGKEGGVSAVTVNGQNFFSKGDWFPANVPVLVTYYTYADTIWY